jgi:release factor glutamine methyltransferase
VVAESSAIVAQLRAAGCVHAEDEARLLMSAARTHTELAELLRQRLNGRPLEHVLGFAEFCGQRIVVTPGVFIPRRRTEFLVHQATQVLTPGAVVVDLCCGTGAIGAALVSSGKRIEVYACDIDAPAVECARRNLAEVAGEVVQGDLYDALPSRLRGSVDLIVTSPPYVPTAALRLLPAEARLHEPGVALDGGTDGMDLQRRIIGSASAWLAPGGHLLVECSDQQATRLAGEVVRKGLVAAVVSSDELCATVVTGANTATHGCG